MKAAIYARVSTRDKSQNPETQLHELRAYCDDRGWAYQEYIDHASGATTSRPALRQLQHDIAWRRVNVVVVYKLDRLARSLPDLLDMTRAWERRGVDFVVTTQNIDTTSQGRFLFYILGAVGELERDMISERVKAGMARVKREGKHIGRPRARVRIPATVIAGLQDGSLSMYAAAKAAGVPRTTLARRLEERGITPHLIAGAGGDVTPHPVAAVGGGNVTTTMPVARKDTAGRKAGNDD